MRMSKLVGRQVKDVPKDAQTPSHVFLIRGGYVRPVSSGIYTLLPLGKRVIAKIEAIVREEMEAVEGQEVLMPVVLPRELWEESGRYTSVGPELLRFEDRNGKDMLLGMTHEEAVMHLARTEITSWRQLPAMLYQIQTKYRDEARPRAGLIRVREFTMKDAYSFHATDEDLAAYYDRVHEAYVRIFDRIGMREVLSIESDTGMMGGAAAHEFMAVSEVGEDTLFVSPDGRYQANREVAVSALTFERGPDAPLTKVSTPGTKTIEDVAALLGVTSAQTGKAVFYVTSEGTLVFAMVRGDLDVNEAKLEKVVGEGLEPAPSESIEAAGIVPGYASPVGVDASAVRIVIDPSVMGSNDLVVGANEVDAHYTGFDPERDLADQREHLTIADIVSVRQGDPCPVSGAPLQLRRGIEVGNIFQLGTKYSAAMNGSFLDEKGKSRNYVMGCYGIGIGRAMASVIEQSHDEHGPVWPIAIAPYAVHLVALNINKAPVREAAEALYAELVAEGLEVIFDDRNKGAGFAFADADLIGAPFRVVVSTRTIKESQAELKRRDKGLDERVAISEVAPRLALLVREEQESRTPLDTP